MLGGVAGRDDAGRRVERAGLVFAGNRAFAPEAVQAAQRQLQRRLDLPGPPGGAEDVLLGMGAVRHLRGDVQPLGEQGDHRLVVLDRLRLLRASGGDAPQRARQQPAAARAAEPGVRVEVVAVRAEDAAELVGRVGDLDLDPGQAPGEEGAEEAGARAGGALAGDRQPVRLGEVRAARRRRRAPPRAGSRRRGGRGGGRGCRRGRRVACPAAARRSAAAARRRRRPPRRPSRRGSRTGRRGRSARRRPPAPAPAAPGRPPRAAGPAPSRRRNGCRR